MLWRSSPFPTLMCVGWLLSLELWILILIFKSQIKIGFKTQYGSKIGIKFGFGTRIGTYFYFIFNLGEKGWNWKLPGVNHKFQTKLFRIGPKPKLDLIEQ